MPRTWTDRLTRGARVAAAIVLLTGAAAAQEDEPGDPPAPVSVSTQLSELTDDGVWARPIRRPWRLQTLGGVAPPQRDDAPRKDTDSGTRLFEVEGPGALVRMWFDGDPGRVQFWIDGRSEPAFVAAAALLRRGELTLMAPPLSEPRGRGIVMRFPFPFRERLAVSVDRPEVTWSADVRRWSGEVRVDPFEVKPAWGAIYGAQETLASWGTRLVPTPADDAELTVARKPDAAFDLEPGAVETIAEKRAEEGAGLALTRLTLEEFFPFFDVGALDRLILTVEVDGEETMAVSLLDLFGGGEDFVELRSPRVTRESLHRGILRKRTARWCMPFARSLVLRLRNDGAESVERLRFLIDFQPFAGAAEALVLRAHTRAFASTSKGEQKLALFEAPAGGAVVVGEVLRLSQPLLEGSPSLMLSEGERESVLAPTVPRHFSAFTGEATGPDASWTKDGVGARWRFADALPLPAGATVWLRAPARDGEGTGRATIFYYGARRR